MTTLTFSELKDRLAELNAEYDTLPAYLGKALYHKLEWATIPEFEAWLATPEGAAADPHFLGRWAASATIDAREERAAFEERQAFRRSGGYRGGEYDEGPEFEDF